MPLPFNFNYMFRQIIALVFQLPLVFHIALAAPPVARVHPVVDIYHGVSVTDPYRWMEDMKSAGFRDWIGGQSAYTRTQLDAIPGRENLAKRLNELAQVTGNVFDMAWGGKHLFYLGLEPGQNSRRLQMRAGGEGPARTLLDPTKVSGDGKRHAIDWFSPSPDGRRVAVGLSIGGSEKSVLHIIDVTTGRMLDDKIEHLYGGGWTVVWLSDGERFFYVRGPAGDKYNRTKVYLHKIGRDVEQDPALFGYQVDPAIHFEPGDYTYFRLAPGGHHVVAVSVPGVSNERRFFTAPLTDILAGPAKWRQLADKADQWFRGYLAGDKLYVLSAEAASRKKVLRVDLGRPNAGVELVMPSGRAVLDDAAVGRDGVYVKGLEAGVARLFRIPFGKGPVQEVKLPFPGSIRELAGTPTRDGVLVKMEGWMQSPRVLAIGHTWSRDSGLIEPAPADFSNVESKQTFAISHDGTRIPITLVHSKGLLMDGARPTIMTAYGAYGFSREPRFDAMNLAWIERGGVIAQAHVRGGGEYGNEWRWAGHLLTKSNTILDFVACAEALTKQGYTSPNKLAVVGASAGGIAVGGAITERPDLFAAANHAVGMADLLRYETEGTGPANIPEFGTVMRKYEFLAMLPVSPYHRVVDGTAYPAVIVTTGINDPRVPAWQPAKFAARLQAASNSGKPILLRTDMDGGHGMGSGRNQRIEETADVWSFFLSAMHEPGFVLEEFK